MQGCQMVYFQTKIPIFAEFWMVLKWKVLVYFMPIWSVLRSFGLSYCHLVYFEFVWYTFPDLVCCTYKVKSGNTAFMTQKCFT
jgi:hypothetical protein